MSLVGVTFATIWVRFALDRKAHLERFRWYPTYGFMVEANGYQLPDDALFDSVVARTIRAWSRFHPDAESIIKREVCWAHFHKDLDETPLNPAKQKVEGFTFVGTHVVYVDFDKPDSPLERTAFEHELGHIIRGYATRNWDMNEHHDFVHRNGLR